ncbi:MAG: 2-C-methyl-D-erythritol 2,4-cyclodiphosphate synthase, partial [Bacteroidota bacterium]|nr:2-C-methyl-D-erythritol 2,4-cyclodiphosphate synthase [Bacteroidota bacterium]
RLEEGIPFWLGGIEIEHHKGSVGHSDADVLLHAICDAILGAAALGDIGSHFPDTDPEFKGIASTMLLRRCGELLNSRGFEIGNIDSTICLQTPKVLLYIPEMQAQIAEHLGLHADQVSVKATTEEKLGFTGREEGVSAYAVVLIQSIS